MIEAHELTRYRNILSIILINIFLNLSSFSQDSTSKIAGYSDLYLFFKKYNSRKTDIHVDQLAKYVSTLSRQKRENIFSAIQDIYQLRTSPTVGKIDQIEIGFRPYKKAALYNLLLLADLAAQNKTDLETQKLKTKNAIDGASVYYSNGYFSNKIPNMLKDKEEEILNHLKSERIIQPVALLETKKICFLPSPIKEPELEFIIDLKEKIESHSLDLEEVEETEKINFLKSKNIVKKGSMWIDKISGLQLLFNPMTVIQEKPDSSVVIYYDGSNSVNKAFIKKNIKASAEAIKKISGSKNVEIKKLDGKWNSTESNITPGNDSILLAVNDSKKDSIDRVYILSDIAIQEFYQSPDMSKYLLAIGQCTAEAQKCINEVGKLYNNKMKHYIFVPGKKGQKMLKDAKKAMNLVYSKGAEFIYVDVEGRRNAQK